MSKITEKNNLKKPLLSIFPSKWKEVIGECDNLEFRNLEHFKYTVSKIKQKEDLLCGVSYENALSMLMAGKSDIEENDITRVENLVKSNLLKRGLITQEVYENYKYVNEGTQVGVDVAKYVAGESDCIITPVRQYIDFFYELYISISYPCTVDNSRVRDNVIRLMTTIKELERQHIFIKVTLVFPGRNMTKNGDTSFFSSIPVFSHNEPKDVKTMCSVINEKLLRKFYFAVIEDIYGENLAYGYGKPVTIPNCMNIGEIFNEIEFFSMVKKAVGVE